MSVLQVYLNWVNSVLSDVGGTPCSGVTTVQEGRIVCQLIDKLCPSVTLQQNVRNSGNTTPQRYLRAALDHMRSHGIKFHFTPQDILDGDIKSILDVLWLIILNYSVHSIGSSPYQRSVGIGKKLLLDWCQRELQVQFDPQNSLTYNLCTGDWFLKLLTKNSDKPLNEDIEREENLKTQLLAIERKYGIKDNLIKPSDITEGTIDEHTLMIYISLLRLKIGDSVDVPLKSPRELSFQPVENSATDDTTSSGKTQEVPAIVFSEAKSPSPETDIDPVQIFTTPPQSVSPDSSPTQSPPRKRSPEGSETSDWMSQSSGSPMSSLHDKLYEQKSPELPAEAETVIKQTISQHVEGHITPSEDGMQKDSSKHSSRIPVRVKDGDESHRSVSSPGRIEGDKDKTVTRKISIKVQRPRSPNSIMAEARARQEQERERKRKEKEELDRKRREEKDEPVMTGSASEADISETGTRVKYSFETDPVKSDDDDIVKDRPKGTSVSVNLPNSVQMNGEIHDGVPVFVMPGQKHDMELLLEALRHARTEASVQDQLIQNAPADQPDFRHVVDKNIEQLEAQLAAVKAQSKELFEDRSRKQEMERGRASAREPHRARRGEGHSPPRGILDVMVNQNVQPQETSPKERMYDESRSTPPGILRNRGRSPTDHVRRLTEDGRSRGESYSPDKHRSSPYQNGTDGDDADKRLIKFLTNEIENMKLKMSVLEQKNQQRSQSPYGMGPRITGGLPERDRSPAQISSRARARFSDSDGNLGSYSPARRTRSTDMIEELRSRSPRFDSPGRSPSRSPRFDSPGRSSSRSPRFDSPGRSSSRSPARSPVGMYRSRTPDRISSRERIRPISPSARVLSLQDLSTSINDDLDGNLTFSPASGSKPVSLGYSSPIRKVNDEIWGYGQTDDDYYADTAKYEGWKQLISREAVTDEDSLELKQALASSLVELNILQAKLKNANSDIKGKMSKTTEVLNDCRAQISTSQAENAELRGQLEREKQNRETQEARLKDMEQNLHSAKTNQDDKKLELEESVITLKGIVNLDKNQMSQLEDENDKLRKKISEFQRENIKLKEISSCCIQDFNELKMYNDKAQQTIKDLKSCLEDARTERNQMVGEIKKLKDQSKNNAVSSIINNYMEKGLYEDAEKDHVADRDRSRSRSPNRFIQPRSVSPVFSRPVTPVRTSSPVRMSDHSYTVSAYTPGSRSQTPTPCSFSYEDISPDGHEIYPHRRTRSYVQKFGAQDVSSSQVDLNDPEIAELLKPKTRLTYDLDDNLENGPQAKRKLLYSPYMDKDFVPRSNQNGYIEKDTNYEQESLLLKKETSHRKSEVEEEWESRKFIDALDHAVTQTPAQLAQQRFLQGLSSTGDDTTRWRSPSKGILKNTKSAQNMSIKENISPSRRSFESRSYSPSVRSPLGYTTGKPASRSYTPEPSSTKSYNPTRSYSNTAQTRSYSPNNRNRSQSPRTVGQRSYSPGNRSSSPGYKGSTTKDSGYSTPTQPMRYRSSVVNDNRDYSRPRTPTSSRSHAEKKSGLLSDEERRYADLLIDKYTSDDVINVQECYAESHKLKPTDLWC
ncbi:serine/arginine repetitive matrix protein 2-like isoform X4 [Mercenaria mercenaria]|uniref:serine/arginine repetitive matrix protein 2-like isoform X4 n=1 Tax=Mercenaria mercenaria TaxID=6596 RepID=UPI00234F3C9C|nr:serine/arginine repetitive matrix protein 2-like isoform X4 [Mercenaria mercenaria]